MIQEKEARVEDLERQITFLRGDLKLLEREKDEIYKQIRERIDFITKLKEEEY